MANDPWLDARRAARKRQKPQTGAVTAFFAGLPEKAKSSGLLDALFGESAFVDPVTKRTVPVLGGPGALSMATLGGARPIQGLVRLLQRRTPKLPLESADALAARLAKEAPAARLQPVASANVPRVPYGAPPTEGYGRVATESAQDLAARLSKEAPVRTAVRPSIQQAVRQTSQVQRQRPVQKVREVVADLRRGLGSREAAQRLNISPEAIKRIAPGPSRTPLAVEIGALEKRFRHLVADPKGEISPALLRGLGGAIGGGTVGGAVDEADPARGMLIGAAAGGAAFGNPLQVLRFANRVRTNAMLSGRAIPLNIATGLGAVGRAAIEGASLAPLREAARLPTNIRVAAKAFKEVPRRGIAQDVGQMRGPFVRGIASIDEMFRQALQRAGKTQPQIDRLLHTTPRAPLFGEKARPVTQAVYPFQTTPLNVVESGATEAANLGRRGVPLIEKALTLASVPYGSGVAETARQHYKKHPLATAILAPAAMAALGPTTAIGTLAGMGTLFARGARPGQPPLGSLAPLPEFSTDPRMLVSGYGGFKPAGLALVERAQKVTQEQRQQGRSRRRSRSRRAASMK